MPRQFNEPWEPEDVFSAADAKAWRAEREERARKHAEVETRETAAEAERRAEYRRRTTAFRDSALIDEYRAAGVDPVRVNEHGVPTVSLTLLRSMGWTIRHFDGEAFLAAPHQEKRKPREEF